MTTPKDTWISVKDGIPINTDNKLEFKYKVRSGDFEKEVYLDWYYDHSKYPDLKISCFRTKNGDRVKNVTHWKLLSKPKNK